MNNNHNAVGGNHQNEATKEVLVQKLQGINERLRRDRDQAHRSKEVAEQHLQLDLEDLQALTKTVNASKEKYSRILGASNEIKAELGPLEAQVKSMTEKMQFQHNELLGSREKIQQRTRDMEQSAKKREQCLHKARQLVHERRLKHEAIEKEETMMTITELPLSLQKERLARELNAGPMFDWNIVPKIMEQQASSLSAKAQRLHEDNQRMENELATYGVDPLEQEREDEAPAHPHVGTRMQVTDTANDDCAMMVDRDGGTNLQAPVITQQVETQTLTLNEATILETSDPMQMQMDSADEIRAEDNYYAIEDRQ